MDTKMEMTKEEFLNTPDEELSTLQFTVPWQYGSEEASIEPDGDGFKNNTSFGARGTSSARFPRKQLQDECWAKFNRNPHVNTSVRGLSGRLTGYGFSTTSEIFDIQEKINEIHTDPRNRLYLFWNKYVARSLVEGELHLCLTPHNDGFVEVDYIDPTDICNGFEEGILWHPTKTMMPLLYCVGQGVSQRYIPSIFVAYYPELEQLILKQNGVNKDLLQKAKYIGKGKSKYNKIGSFKSYIVSWDKSFLTKRTVSYLVTTLEWLNYYENLKKYEIDHKKSSGAYLWTFSFENIRDFKAWLMLSDEDRRKTGITAKKVPGGSLVLPPGVKCDVKNPNLSKITDQDNDILQMISSGLNEPEDVMTGKSGGTFASVKASRGPMGDRTSDEVSFFENFLIYDFWRPVFYLSSVMGGFKENYRVVECVGYEKTTQITEQPIPMIKMAEDKKKPADNKKTDTAGNQPKSVPQPMKQIEKEVVTPIFKTIKRKAHELIEIMFPVSDSVDYEGRARGLLGVKHGSVADTLGISKAEIAKRIGLNGYGYLRRKADTENERFPATIAGINQESFQEQNEAEPKLDKGK